MPELPDIAAYIEALKPRVKGRRLRAIRIASPLLLRTVEPAPEACCDKQVQRFRRLGKRIAIGLEDDYWLVLHLMIAGRLHWRDQPAAKLPGKRGLAAFDFPDGTLLLTEAGSKRRASLHVTRGSDTLDALHRGGLEVLEASPAEFGDAMRRRNRTLKRALTDPSICSGIGNAYSDEILHRARLSPVALTGSLDEAEIQRLFAAARDGMAVHGRYRQPCPDCGAPVQRIRYAANETNYCARCQTDGKLLKDRALSRLLRGDWPRSLDELSDA